MGRRAKSNRINIVPKDLFDKCTNFQSSASHRTQVMNVCITFFAILREKYIQAIPFKHDAMDFYGS